MFCSQCGKEIQSGSQFCRFCGKQPIAAAELPQPPAQPQLSPVPVADPLAIPVYLRWYVILPFLFFWPGWYPVGPIAAMGLWFIRMRAVPASRAFLGWFNLLLGVPWLLIWVLGLTQEKMSWKWYVVAILFFFTLLFVAYAIRMVFQARKAKKLIALVHKQQMRTVDEVTHALGRTDTAAVRAEIGGIMRRGWLDGYSFDAASSHIAYTAIPANFFQTIWRSKLGVCFLLLAGLLFLPASNSSSGPLILASNRGGEIIADFLEELKDFDFSSMFQSAPEKAPPRHNTKDGLSYAWIPPGHFMMGCSPKDKDCTDFEQPRHLVVIKNGFWLGQTEVTQDAWQRIMSVPNPSRFKGGKLPVEQVPWYHADSYCKSIGGRLPSEAEWEYAARAGTKGPLYGKFDEIVFLAPYGDYSHSSGPVGSAKPNAFGLYDTIGNVSEWVQDNWPGDTWPPSLGRAGLSAIGMDKMKLRRGGSSWMPFTSQRVSARGYGWFDKSDSEHSILDAANMTGFRCAINSPGPD